MVRPVTVFVHELGHVIPSLLLTNNEVEMYLGSYGNPLEGGLIKISRLHIFYNYNPVLWTHGLCTQKELTVSLTKNFIIILLGPLISLIFGFAVCYLLILNFEDGRVRFFGVMILVSSLLDFYQNIKPNEKPVMLYNGSITYNDGQQLKQIIKYHILPKDYRQANELYKQKKYDAASKLYLKLIHKGNKDDLVLKLAITSLVFAKDYQTAQSVYEENSEKIQKESDILTNVGLAFSRSGAAQKSIELYDEALTLNPNNIYALNNRGYQRIINKEYDKAIDDFNKSIEINPNFAYPLSNRGYAKIELGLEEKGFQDIMRSLRMDAENSYAYRNLGIYYFRKNDMSTALLNFERALKLDPDTDQINEWIDKASKK